MWYGLHKKGLSPVIATVLLISIVMVLAAIIMIWATGFISENVQKFQEPIENSCNNVKFKVEADVDKVSIVNEGNVPLYGLEVSVSNRGGTKSSGLNYDKSGKSILSGSGGNAEVDLSGIGVSVGDRITLIPIILGEVNGGKVMHVCDIKYGVPTVVK